MRKPKIGYFSVVSAWCVVVGTLFWRVKSCEGCAYIFFEIFKVTSTRARNLRESDSAIRRKRVQKQKKGKLPKIHFYITPIFFQKWIFYPWRKVYIWGSPFLEFLKLRLLVFFFFVIFGSMECVTAIRALFYLIAFELLRRFYFCRCLVDLMSNYFIAELMWW